MLTARSRFVVKELISERPASARNADGPVNHSLRFGTEAVSTNVLAPPPARNNRQRLPAIIGAMRGVEDVVAFTDTIELFFRGSTIPALGAARKRLHDVQRGRGKLPRFKPVKMFTDGQVATIGWRFLVNHPSAEALNILDDIMLDHRATMHRVDVAVDYITKDQAEARAIMLALRQCLVLRFNRSNGMPDEEFGTYWVRYKDVRKKPPRNVLAYWDRDSKVRRQPCCHIEIRFIGSEAVRRMTERFGIKLPSDLTSLRPVDLFAHNFVVGNVDQRSLDDLHARVPMNIARHLTQGYRVGLLQKFGMLKPYKLDLGTLKLPAKMEM